MRINFRNFYFFRSDIGILITEYIAWKKEHVSELAADNDKPILTKFAKHCKKSTLEGIEARDVENYRLHLIVSSQPRWRVLTEMTAISCFLRYNRARKRSCVAPIKYSIETILSLTNAEDNIRKMLGRTTREEEVVKKVGRPIKDPVLIEKVKFLKNNEAYPLSVREIARVIGREPSQIHRWIHS